MLTGLTYNGTDRNGNTLWDGCTNAKISLMETFTTFRGLVASFNINTNSWMGKLVLSNYYSPLVGRVPYFRDFKFVRVCSLIDRYFCNMYIHVVKKV